MSKQELFETVLDIRQSLHDLAQPLAVLTGLIDLLLLEVEADNPRLKEIHLINEQLEKVLNIVGEIRNLAQEATAGAPIRSEPSARQTP